MSEAHKETLGFQTEIKQLLDLMIHSLYSNRDIFLRELISNASDACDKLRFEALDNDALYAGDSDLGIWIEADRKARTISVRDNGVGMNRDEAIRNLGTIARSGTREFFSQLTGDRARDASLIGQFGVGFYSSFIVAQRVTVESRRAGDAEDQGIRWVSTGDGEFTIETITRKERGTTVTLQLRDNDADGEDGHEYDSLLDAYKLRQLVRNYSDHIAVPVRMKAEKWDAEKQEMEETGEWEVVNQAKALWLRPRNEVTEKEYDEFYRHITHDFEGPLAYTHNRVEGRSEYTQLLYIPKHAPFDLWDRQQRHGIRLYVRRVFIMDDAERLARDPAGEPRHPADPRGQRPPCADTAGGSGRKPQGRLCALLACLWPGAEGGRGRRQQEPREDRRPAALPYHRRADPHRRGCGGRCTEGRRG